jgi:YVTN family beta-propeller protein
LPTSTLLWQTSGTPWQRPSSSAISGRSGGTDSADGHRLHQGRKLAFLALGPENRVAVIVANGLTNDMTVIDVATLKAEKSVPVGRLPGA